MTRIKAIIFDLDDTLLDTTDLIKDVAIKKAIDSMISSGLNTSKEKAFKNIKEILNKDPCADKFRILAENIYKNKNKKELEKIIKSGKDAYYSYNINTENIKLEKEIKDTLIKLNKEYTLALISTGNPKLQFQKIDALGLREFFNHIYINQKDTKEECFLEAVEALGIKANRIMGIGDRLDVDIKASNKLGLTSVQIKKGTYKNLKPKSELEKPDYKIKKIVDILDILENIKNTENKLEKGPKIALIGGGTGLPTLLEGLKHYTYNLSAIVTITDAGRSSGRLRKDLNILPPGDIRNNLIALSDSEKVLHDLLQYRFEDGDLKGHSVGNLLIAALTKMTGNFETAIKEMSKILNLKGGVYPASLQDTNICAELDDGTILNNEQEIVIKGERIKSEKRSPIKKMFITPKDAKANPSAIEAIQDADAIIIGPGSLLTSVIPNLLIKDIRNAINNSKAKKIYICNIVTQPGQTQNFSASKHLKTIKKYLEGNIDYIILNSQEPSEKLKKQYKQEKCEIVENDISNIKEEETTPIVKNLLESIKEKKLLWEKQYLLRHDSEKVAELIIDIISGEQNKG